MSECKIRNFTEIFVFLAELVQTNNAHHTANTNDDTDHVTDASL